MVALSLMARLMEAVRPDARLIFVGDPEQLASVEAGAVLGDIVGPAAWTMCMGTSAREQLAVVCGQDVPEGEEGPRSAIGDGIVVLRQVHRYGGAIAELAEAIQHGDADGAMAVLDMGDTNVQWIAHDASASTSLEALDDVRSLAVDCGRAVREAAKVGNAPEALSALGRFRLLSAHRRGPGHGTCIPAGAHRLFGQQERAAGPDARAGAGTRFRGHYGERHQSRPFRHGNEHAFD